MNRNFIWDGKWFDLAFLDYAEEIKLELPQLQHFDWDQLPEDIKKDYLIAPSWTDEDGLPVELEIETKSEYNSRAYGDIQSPELQNEFEQYWNEKMKHRGNSKKQ